MGAATGIALNFDDLFADHGHDGVVSGVLAFRAFGSDMFASGKNFYAHTNSLKEKGAVLPCELRAVNHRKIKSFKEVLY